MFKSGDEVVTLYSFEGVRPEDLAFKRKEIITILGTTKDPNWLRARHPSGRVGLIPHNYVTPVVISFPWFHGQISRQETERLLSGSPDGTYLVRESVKFAGDYTLAITLNGEVSQYRITSGKRGYTLDDEDFFPDLKALVNHYKQKADGLCCSLRDHVPSTHQLALSALKEGGWVKRRDQLQLHEKIGQGEFGEVVKAKYENRIVAVKCFKKKNSTEEKLFTYEASVMMSLKHSNLVTFLGMAYDSDQVFLITEFMENGALVNYLRSRGRTIITQLDQIRFALDTCNGMTYLEEQQLVHRDLAARNVLLGRNLEAKVADFGLAQRSTDPSPTESGSPIGPAATLDPFNKNFQVNPTASGSLSTSPKPPVVEPPPGDPSNRIPIKWTAPEAVRHNKFTSKADVWSFGVLLWEIYSFGRMPYPRLMASQVLRNLELGYRMESPENCPVDVYEMMKACWRIDPLERPNFDQMLTQLSAQLQTTSVSQSSPPTNTDSAVQSQVNARTSFIQSQSPYDTIDDLESSNSRNKPPPLPYSNTLTSPTTSSVESNNGSNRSTNANSNLKSALVSVL